MVSRIIRPSATLLANINKAQSLQGNGFGFYIAARPLTTGTTKSNASGYQEGPERDLVNFPRPKRLEYCPPVRLGFIPSSYFDFFYAKTGVTGPYAFGVGFLTYVLSKEIWVLEHEFWGGVSFFGMIIFVAKKFGPQIGAYLDKEIDAIIAEKNSDRNNEIQMYKEGIENEKKAQWRAEGQKMLFDVKRENVALQIEAVYRERLMHVYSEVKKRLDYQVEKQQVERNMQQKHMVNWITTRVQKAITPESEAENLKKCIGDLKALAAKY